MFGTLKPHLCALDEPSEALYRSYYCGTCKSLGDQFGLLYRGLLSHDAVFLALVVDGLTAEASEPSSCRCPAMPIQIRTTRAPQSVSMRYAGAMQMMLADQWLADRALDGRSLAAWLRPVLGGPSGDARETLRGLSIPIEALDGFELQQKGVERAGQTGPAEAAEPTAQALAFVFEHMADLPTVSAPREALAELGAAVGRLIYVTDALLDIEEDLLAGDFNPHLVEDASGRLSLCRDRVEQSDRLIAEDHRRLRTALESVGLVRNEDVIENILERRLLANARRELRSARQKLEPEQAASLEKLAATRGPERWALRAMAAVVLVWFWLQTRLTAFAQEVIQRGEPIPPAVGEGGEVPDVPTPDVPSPPTDVGDLGGGGSPGTGGESADLGDAVGDLLGDARRVCENPCNGCGNPCSGCSAPCNDCGNPCDQCCGSCTGCCDSCNGCGNCCNGCNGCNC